MKNIWRLILCIKIAIVCIGCSPQSNIEWVNNHPWRAEYNIEFMPVFRNLFHMIPNSLAQYEGLSANGFSVKEMTIMAENIIDAIGLEADNISITNSIIVWMGEVPIRAVTARVEDVEVTVEPNGSLQIIFENGIPYISEHLAAALGLDSGDTVGDIIKRILDYHFNIMHLTPNSNGDLWRIDKSTPMDIMLSEKIGYFPIIKPGEVIERMLDGQGSFGVDMGQPRPTPDNVIDMRLVYFGHSLGRNFLEEFAPWYELIIQKPELDYLQSFFVPAIQTEYLEANPAWSVYPHQ